MKNDTDSTAARPVGRPAKALDVETLLRVLEELAKPGTFAEACARAGTSAYVVKRAMARSDRVSYEVRLRCMRTPGRKRLCEAGADPDLLFELAREATEMAAGDYHAPRPWEDVQAAIARHRGMRAAMEAAKAKVAIREAQTPEEEAF